MSACRNHDLFDNWRRLFMHVQKHVDMTSINIYSPIHNDVLSHSKEVDHDRMDDHDDSDSEGNTVHIKSVSSHYEAMIFISIEGPLVDKDNKLLRYNETQQLNYIPTQTYISSDPPTYINSSPFVITMLNLSTKHHHNSHNSDFDGDSDDNMRSVTVVVSDNHSISVSVDFSVNRYNFGIDRRSKYVIKANEVVLYNTRRQQNLFLNDTSMLCSDAESDDIAIDIDGTILIEESTMPSSCVPYEEINYSTSLPTTSSSTTTSSSSSSCSFSGNDDDNLNINMIDEMNYLIIVITYSRSLSLQRLLTSLSSAFYGNHTNIPLHIYIDGYKSLNIDYKNVMECQLIAEKFKWKYGEKIVTLRPKNIGLLGQWFNAWKPINDSQAAFIFEDDVEVSPYYFIWATQAVDKYYLHDKYQQKLHHRLYDALRKEVDTNGATQEYIATSYDYHHQSHRHRHDYQPRNKHSQKQHYHHHTMKQSPLDRFLYLTAGKPLLYGVCLQKQHLDPHHYPKKLSIRNSYRPYLYSLIGSWGPLFFPIMWRGFKEWWQWKYNLFHSKKGNNDNDGSGGSSSGSSSSSSSSRDELPHHLLLTEDLVVNHFYHTNNNIWTPWIVRFAYETSAKCLYSNLPSDFALVVNHREVGENYRNSLGKDALLISHDDLINERTNKSIVHDDITTASINSTTKFDNSDDDDNKDAHHHHHLDYESALDSKLSSNIHPSMKELLQWSLRQLPDMSFLARYQYDYNLRRIGSIGIDAAYVTFPSSSEMDCYSKDNSYDDIKDDSPDDIKDDSHDDIQDDGYYMRYGREVYAAYHEIDVAIETQAQLLQSIRTMFSSSGSSRSSSSDTSVLLSRQHWIYIIDILQANNILPYTNILHLGFNPYIMLSSVHDHYHHYIYMGTNQSMNNEDLINKFQSSSSSLPPTITFIYDLAEYRNLLFSLVIVDLENFMEVVRNSRKNKYSPHNLSSSSITKNNNNKNNIISNDTNNSTVSKYHSLHSYIQHIVWDHLQFIPHIAVVDICSGAPTHFSINYRNEINENKRNTSSTSSSTTTTISYTVDYFIVEDVCALGSHDLGVVMYR